ncbi:DUF1741-domain-containing protein [Dentipellis sp. KUC8613]|nr:DUF1741-domain-containing protein [Dentipellis sp. KUC8613]
MYSRRDSIQYVSKFVSGQTAAQINPKEDEATFWSNLLLLDVDRSYLTGKFAAASKEDCLGHYKPLINTLFATCLEHARTVSHDDPKKVNALEIMAIFMRCLLSKSDLAGWEVMELFAGSVNDSDKFFMDFVSMIDNTLSDEQAPASLRHDVLQLAIIFMCGINQLSPGAYFLRRDLYPAVISIVKSPETQRFTFEALLLLALMANFHQSDAAKLNPYLQRIAETEDWDVLHKMIWAANHATLATIKAYQDISDDSPPTIASTLGSFLTSLRPDRMLASKPIDPPRELFKNQLTTSQANRSLSDSVARVRSPAQMSRIYGDDAASKTHPTPLPYSLISLSSYLLTHATSLASLRAVAYANFALHILLAFVEKDELMKVVCQPSSLDIRLCRQRLPTLPIPKLPRPPLCALLDCCVLWLRHNLHKRLEVSLYLLCIRTCHRVIWFLQKERIRLEYNWQELWSALLGLLDFLASKIDTLHTTEQVEGLVRETILLLDLAICKADVFLPTPEDVHRLIYEFMRSALVLRKQQSLLKKLSSKVVAADDQAVGALSRLLEVADFYQAKVGDVRIRSANDAMRVVAKDVEQDGIHGVKEVPVDDPP